MRKPELVLSSPTRTIDDDDDDDNLLIYINPIGVINHIAICMFHQPSQSSWQLIYMQYRYLYVRVVLPRYTVLEYLSILYEGRVQVLCVV